MESSSISRIRQADGYYYANRLWESSSKEAAEARIAKLRKNSDVVASSIVMRSIFIPNHAVEGDAVGQAAVIPIKPSRTRQLPTDREYFQVRALIMTAAAGEKRAVARRNRGEGDERIEALYQQTLVR